MHEEILTRARWLLAELHLPPAEAAAWLKDYFPNLEFEERSRYLREARELLDGDPPADSSLPPLPPLPSLPSTPSAPSAPSA